MRNWKTTLAGILALITAITPVISQPEKLMESQTISAILAGIGLLLAKDWNVSGGSLK